MASSSCLAFLTIYSLLEILDCGLFLFPTYTGEVLGVLINTFNDILLVSIILGISPQY